jgi:hypothetical protein
MKITSINKDEYGDVIWSLNTEPKLTVAVFDRFQQRWLIRAGAFVIVRPSMSNKSGSLVLNFPEKLEPDIHLEFRRRVC